MKITRRSMTGSFSLLALVALALGAALAAPVAAQEPWQPPSWYHGKDGPIFDVLQTQQDIQLRRYQPGKWVSTNVTNSTFGDAYKEGAKRLDEFWNGGNKNGTQVDDTVPTLTIIYPSGVERTISTTFTVEYFLPNELHAAPPLPQTPEVELLDIPAQEVWVHTFGGYVQEKDAIEQAFGFLEKLKGSGVDVGEVSFLGVAVYDDPLRLVGRHNEVWVWPTGEFSPAPSVTVAARSGWLVRLWERLSGRVGSQRQSLPA